MTHVMRSPRNVDIEITTKCNLRCTYCSHFSSAGDVAEDLPALEWRQFFSELESLCVMRVVFSGGEPFFREDFLDIIANVASRPMRFAILTNGTLIDKDIARFLASTRRLDYIQISLDGADAKTHDSFRGSGTFTRACRGIQALMDVGIVPVVRVTIHRKNFNQLREIARFILEDLSLPSFSTNAASYMGLCRYHATSTQLTPTEYSEAIETLLELTEIYPGRINATAGPLADLYAWRLMEQARLGLHPPPQGGGFLTGCNGPFQAIAVRADGVFTPCQQLGHLALGRINRDPLISIWQDHPILQELRERSQIPLTSFPMCRDCPYVFFCTGNCPATAYTQSGQVNTPSPEGCLFLFLQRGGRLPAFGVKVDE
jgi:SynChlorMet cassette radical SAM/SPASM protein ScmE